jgi:hypothetical protein
MQARTLLCVCTRVAVYLGYCMCVHAYMSALACTRARTQSGVDVYWYSIQKPLHRTTV